MYKELKKLVIKRTNNPIKKKWSTDLNRELSTEESKMAERQLRKCSTSLVIREIQIKRTLRFHLILARMAQIKNTDDNLCCRDCGEKETLLHCLWECKLVQPAPLDVSVAISQKIRKQPSSRPSNITFGYISKGCSIVPQGHVLNYVHSSIVCHSQNLETT